MTEEQLAGLGYVFPERVNVLLSRNKEGKYSLTFTKFRNKRTKLENIKFSDTGALFFDGSSVTSLGIYDFANFDDFYKEIDRLNASWTSAKGVPAE